MKGVHGLLNSDGLPKPGASEAISTRDGLLLYSRSNANDKCYIQATSVQMYDDSSHATPLNMAEKINWGDLYVLSVKIILIA